MKKSHLTTICILGGIFLLRHVFTLTWGFSVYEEGYPAYIYDQINQGRQLYVDLGWHFGPLGPYLFALVFRIFGAEILHIRIAALLVALGALTGLYLIAQELTDRIRAAAAAFLSLCMFFFWFYKYEYVIGFAAAVWAVFLVYKDLENPRRSLLALSVIMTAAAVFQNLYTSGGPVIGAAVCTLVFVAREPSDRRTLLKYLAGAVVLTCAVYILLLFVMPLKAILTFTFPMFTGIYPMPNRPFPFANLFDIYNISFPQGFSAGELYAFAKRFVYVLIYYIPVAVVVMQFFSRSLIRQFDRNRQTLYYLFFFFALFSLVRPYTKGPEMRSDAFSFAPAVMLFILQLCLLSKKLAGRKLKIFNFLTIAGLLGAYLIIQVPNFNPDLHGRKFDIPGYRGLWNTEAYYRQVSDMTGYIQQNAPPGSFAMTGGQYGLHLTTGTREIMDHRFTYFYLVGMYREVDTQNVDTDEIVSETVRELRRPETRVIVLDGTQYRNALDIPGLREVIEDEFELDSIKRYTEDNPLYDYALPESIYFLRKKSP